MTPDHGADDRRNPSSRSAGQGILAVEKVQKSAEDERTRLLERDADKWKIAFENALAQEPLLVVGRQRAYYLVEFRKETDSRTTALMLIHPDDARVGSVAAIEKPDGKIQFYQRAQIPALLDKRDELVPNDKGGFPPAVRVTLTSGNIKVARELYWDPCDQSVTPFKPFYVATHVAGDYQFEARLFVRVDGEVFTQITFGGAGM